MVRIIHEQVCNAAKRGDLAGVRSLVERRLLARDVNERNRVSCDETFRLLGSSMSRMCECYQNGFTPLLLAAERSHLPVG